MQNITNIDNVSKQLSLAEFQKNVLRENCDKYNLSGLIKRGKVLYAPHHCNANLAEFLQSLFFGKKADLIGANKILLSSARRIKLYAYGYHCVNMGRHKYWADENGQAISKDILEKICGKKGF